MVRTAVLDYEENDITASLSIACDAVITAHGITGGEWRRAPYSQF